MVLVSLLICLIFSFLFKDEREKEEEREKETEIIVTTTEADKSVFPEGLLTLDEEQVDLRKTNSWRLTLEQISTREFLEVQAVNAVAPFIITARLRDLMKRSPLLHNNRNTTTTTTTTHTTTSTTHTTHTTTSTTSTTHTTKKTRVVGPEEVEKGEGEGSEGDEEGTMEKKFIINVSAMEGQFYRFKTERHPHTNMAKVCYFILFFIIFIFILFCSVFNSIVISTFVLLFV